MAALPAPDGSGPRERGLAEVLALALVEAKRYGDDDDVWVRELVQNARDAAARTITFSVDDDGDVVVDDDGSGMSRAVVIGQLLRLFSSSKDRDRGAAGCFGVGFWSVLRARPSRIEIDSHDGGIGVSVVIDVDGGVIGERAARRSTRGTSIRLVAPRPTLDRARIRAAIDRHAAMVDGRDGPPPRLLLRGPAGLEPLNRPFSLDGVVGVIASAPVTGPGFAGFVGLSTVPRVELFHHGLRVVEATALSTLVPSLKRRPRRGLGLVVRVDAPGLKVLVDRRTVVEDDVVRALVRACDVAATRLERAVLDDDSPLPLPLRLLDGLGRAMARPAVRVASTFAVAVALGVGGGLLGLRELRPDLIERWRPARAPVVDATPQGISDAVAGLGAPRIDVLGQTPAGFALATRHIQDDLLAIDVRALPDDDAGLVPAGPSPSGRAPALSPSGPVVATAQLRGRGPTVLPSSLVLWPVRALVSGVEVPILATTDRLPLVEVPGGADGVIDVFYGLTPSRAPRPGPFVPLAGLDPIVAAASGARDLEAVRRIGGAVASAIRYSAAVDDARRFNSDGRPLVERALTLGVGDCDVINTVYVRALQQAGFPAHLARGFVVRDDTIATELHAWGEVFVDDAWYRVDASPPAAMPVPVIGGREPGGSSVAGTSTMTSGATTMMTAASTGTPVTAAPIVRPVTGNDTGDNATTALKIAAAVATLALAAALTALARRRRRDRRQRPARDDVIELVVTGLLGGAAEHLGLLHRPILPTDRGPISLARARVLAARGRLALATGGRRHPALHRRVLVLDRHAPRVVALRPFLPRVVDLDDVDPALEAVLRPLPPDDVLAPIQTRLDRTFRTVALRPVPGPGLRELHLRTRDGRTHQILVGDDVRALPGPGLWRRLVEEMTSLWLLRGRR